MRTWVAVGLWLLGSVTLAAEPTVAELIERMGHPEFMLREEATQKLWKMGEPARKKIEAAVHHPQAEIAERAKSILEKFNSGYYADTPEAVIREIRQFQSGDEKTQKNAIDALLKQGQHGTAALSRLMQPHTDFRPNPPSAELTTHLAFALRNEVPRRIVAEKWDEAEALLALNALNRSQEGVLDYIQFLRMRNRLKPIIAEYETEIPLKRALLQQRDFMLVFLYQAADRQTDAYNLARKLEVSDAALRELIDALLEESGSWAMLAERTPVQVNSYEGLKAFRFQRAGEVKKVELLLESQRESTNTSTNRTPIDPPTMALLLNDRSADAIERMRENRNAPQMLADLFFAQMRFREALDILDHRSKVDRGEVDPALEPLYAARRGRILAQLGDTVKATELFERVAEQITTNSRSEDHLVQLLRAEMRSGLYELACKHHGQYLLKTDRDRGSQSIAQDAFEVVFQDDAEHAEYLWRQLFSSAAPPTAETMGQIRKALAGQAPAEVSERFISTLRKSSPEANSPSAKVHALTLGALLRARGEVTAALAVMLPVAEHFAKNPLEITVDDYAVRVRGRGHRSWVFGTDETYRFWQVLGEWLLEAQDAPAAARWLKVGHQQHPGNPILLYLAGQALIQAGQREEGEKHLEQAHWVPLGSARVRGRFLEHLLNRGQLVDARRVAESIRQCGWMPELFIGNVWNQVARASVIAKDFDSAALAQRKSLHYLLRTPGVSYIEGHAYITVPQGIRGHEARGLLKAGKVEAAMRMAKDCLNVAPSMSDLVIGMVPELEKQNRKTEADELFRKLWNNYTTLVKEHPQSAWAKHSAAWLAAGCDRELGTALKYAQEAVKAQPQQRHYRECLAEVHFRLNQRQEAQQLMQTLIQEDRNNFHYKRQLERYRHGERTSPIPDADN
ncbi:MAG: hypothetical protein ACRC8S_06735 [Fimbriiglobus sp.]